MTEKSAKNQGVIKKEITWGGRTLSFETGRIETQADSTILARYGDTVVLVTVAHAQASEDLGYFPLSVEFEEKF